VGVDRFELPAEGVLAARLCLAQRLPAGDPYRIRAAARRCGGLAAELRRCSAVLLSSADSESWRGAAHRAFAATTRSKAPRLSTTADRYEQYASALTGYAAALADTTPRLAAARQQLQIQHAAATDQPAGQPVDQAHLLRCTRDFKTNYDQWADALDRCSTALLRANTTDPTRDRHGLQALGHTLDRTEKYLNPLGYVLAHPSLANLSHGLSILNTELSVLGLALLLICPPAAGICFTTAAALSLAQLGIDTDRRAHGEHLTTTTLALQAAAAIPIGGTAFRSLHAGEDLIHLVPGGGLLTHETAGGHTLAKHVGKTTDFLRNRLAIEPDIRAASAFYDREVAEMSISALIFKEDSRVARWLSTGGYQLRLDGRMEESIGYLIPKGSMTASPASGLRVILRRNSSMGSGYLIHTAMVTE
jgi:uncharacterized protein YukE